MCAAKFGDDHTCEDNPKLTNVRQSPWPSKKASTNSDRRRGQELFQRAAKLENALQPNRSEGDNPQRTPN